MLTIPNCNNLSNGNVLIFFNLAIDAQNNLFVNLIDIKNANRHYWIGHDATYLFRLFMESDNANKYGSKQNKKKTIFKQ